MLRALLVLPAMAAIAAGAQTYPASLIPDSLRENADAVERMQDLHVVIRDGGRTVIREKVAITVLDEAGNKFARYHQSYSKMFALSDISGRLYDKDGKLVQTIHRRDITDEAMENGTELLTDMRTKSFSFYQREYPYTVEFEDEIDEDGTMFLPWWDPVKDERFSVQQSRFTVEAPTGYQVRFRQEHYEPPPMVTNGKTTAYSWELNGRKAVPHETYRPKLEEGVAPAIYVEPADFTLGGLKGNMSSWKEFGNFMSGLYKGRDVLPDNVRQDVHRIADPLHDPAAKIRALYAYLQQSTRYISVQLGIGGWQPFDAKYVAEKKYGDCKALSNYMVSLLKEAGITAYPVLITGGAGASGLTEEFPSPRFNHAIACVPFSGAGGRKDTLWLECTSQTTSPGFLSDFTDNRKALLLTDNGGVVVRTPAYTAADNRLDRRVNAVVTPDGRMTAEVNAHYTGVRANLASQLLHRATEKERRDYLNRILHIPTYQVDAIDYKETKDLIPAVDEHFKVESDDYASMTSRRLFIDPNIFNRDLPLPRNEHRVNDIVYHEAFSDRDSIFIDIPPGYAIESAAQDLNLHNRFGEYHIAYRLVGDRIELIRSLRQQAGRFPAADYQALYSFHERIYHADHGKMVLVKKGD